MITADQASNITEQSMKFYDEALNSLSEKIKSEAKKGNNSLEYRGYPIDSSWYKDEKDYNAVSKKFLKTLRDNGFKAETCAEHGSFCTDIYLEIKW